ncbi:MAG: LacI family DNA-binding transcriptional regulator [Candidatus Omnitrophica bacterium]|nr:LacI family DNA-binding transcriptional regulator [Candidatus Omnitrophota bacterium]MDD5670761.1 LacI family DNA-binding transcriptional regulator [Candidatus Omnitrophota bacterium]
MPQKNRVTIKDIAKEAGCHYSLVSLALREETAHRVNPETRKQILEICERLNYFPDHSARQLVSRESNTIVFALPFFAEMIASEPFAKMISGVMSGATEHGLDLHFLLAKEGKMDTETRELLHGKRMAGIVTAAPDTSADFFEELKKMGVPVIVICTYHPGHGTHHVYCDNELASLNAVSYLAQCGHERIAMIKGPNQSCDAKARFTGYLKALKKHKIALDENLIVGATCFSVPHGYEATQTLFSRFEKPTAICCANDDLAIGCLKALKEARIKCPEEVSVVGFDNIAITEYTHPPLTTVEQPFFKMGQEAVALMLDILEFGDKKMIDRCIDAKFIVRESVSQNQK